MNYVQRLPVDIRHINTFEQLYTKQYDKGYPLVFEVYKDRIPFDLSGVTASFQLSKPDGNIILTEGIVSGNTVTVMLTEQMTAAYGKCEFQIVLSENEQSITTITGVMKVDPSVVRDDAIQSDSALSLIQQAIDAVPQAQAAATLAESYAVGTGGARPHEETDNALYYYELARDIAHGIEGAMMPMGSIQFASLATADKQPGYVYCITDDFITDNTFEVGAGVAVDADTSIYCQLNMKWAILGSDNATAIPDEDILSIFNK